MAIPLPVTKTIISTSQWGVPITNEVNRLTGLVNADVPTTWTAMALVNGWTNYGQGYAIAAYRKIGDIVYVRGHVAGGAIGAVIFAFPGGYRPPVSLQFNVASYGTFGIVTLDQAGALYPNAPSDTRFLGINFVFSTIS